MNAIKLNHSNFTLFTLALTWRAFCLELVVESGKPLGASKNYQTNLSTLISGALQVPVEDKSEGGGGKERQQGKNHEQSLRLYLVSIPL